MGTFCFDCSTSFLDSSSSGNGSTFPSGDLLVNKIGIRVSLGFPSFSKNLIFNIIKSFYWMYQWQQLQVSYHLLVHVHTSCANSVEQEIHEDQTVLQANLLLPNQELLLKNIIKTQMLCQFKDLQFYRYLPFSVINRYFSIWYTLNISKYVFLFLFWTLLKLSTLTTSTLGRLSKHGSVE
ncbi:hypothetical protein AGLY_000826 [Aphis glycines]|uniref:Uncharacterized protein n=1 Tax=Aphis glycines TaxID=307491 RepID=A0A6G0U8K7_APHGL|nr:hypothetical protein AGLY_000826 [Aphis glycines]